MCDCDCEECEMLDESESEGCEIISEFNKLTRIM